MKKITLIFLTTLMIAGSLVLINSFQPQPALKGPVSGGPSSIGAENPHSRRAWEAMRLRNPVTGEIPNGMARRENEFAKTLPSVNDGMAKTDAISWEERGPWNVGGRTRALALDIRDENTIWAGGVSGGIWRSTDAGQSWSQITPKDQFHSATCITQDVRPGKEDTWYYGTGEAYGNSPSAPGAFFLGNGVYKTIDNGATWTSVAPTASNTPQTFDEFWDLVWRVATDPSDMTNDVVYAATYGTIYRSGDGGTTWTEELGGGNSPWSYFADVVVTSDGTVYATLSSESSDKGIWRSTDGMTWTNITDPGFPAVYDRIVMGVNPSNENEIYFFGVTPGAGQTSITFLGEEEQTSLYKYTYVSGDGSGAGGQWDDLTANIPVTGPSNFDHFYAQGSYNMVIRVKPDDPNMVLIGGTNLYRSTDGFTSPNNTTQIGGYQVGTTFPDFQLYANHHPDNHEAIFLPSDPDVLISGNDGGIHRTDDVMAGVVEWARLNNGYLTTQLYTVLINEFIEDDIIIGGFQDNGNFFTNTTNLTDDWVMPLNGDGAFSAVSNDGSIYYLSIQRGKIFKMALDGDGNPTAFRRIDPSGAQKDDYAFINPFVLDPNNNDIMYVAEGKSLWRNDQLSTIPMTNEWDSIPTGWHLFSDSVPFNGNNISAIAVSKEPANIVYYGTSLGWFYRIDNAHTGDPAATDLTFPGFPGGNINCVAVDPYDAEKLMVAFSNYEVYSLFYSEDGGQTWDKVAGNLEQGSNNNGSGNGPSLRWINILPVDGENLYIVGTSVGLFATDSLAGTGTVWKQIGKHGMGNVVVEMMKSRESDGLVVVGTHGAGIFSGNVSSAQQALGRGQDEIEAVTTGMGCFPNPVTDHVTITIRDPGTGKGKLEVIDIKGQVVKTIEIQAPSGDVQNVRLNTSEFHHGIYYARFSGENFQVSTSFVVFK